MKALDFEILNVIFDFCTDDSFKIIDINDIMDNLSDDFKCSNDELFKIIDDLATEDCIQLKYKDEEDICLSITTKGKRLIKKERETRERLEEQKRLKEEENARLKAEQEEKERELEKARIALEEMQAQRKKKKSQEAKELEQQVQALEKEITTEVQVEEEKEVKNELVSVEEINYKPIVRKVATIAFVGGLIGSMLGSAVMMVVRMVLGK